jgi:hypothetical protein
VPKLTYQADPACPNSRSDCYSLRFRSFAHFVPCLLWAAWPLNCFCKRRCLAIARYIESHSFAAKNLQAVENDRENFARSTPRILFSKTPFFRHSLKPPPVWGPCRVHLQFCQKKELLFVRQRRFPKSCGRRECNHIRLLCCDRRKGHPLRLGDAVLTPQMAVSFHRQRATVLVSKPA